MSSGAAGPPIHRFSRLLTILDESNDSRSVVRLVERWAEHGGVTQSARMAQARAFMDLCLMDRAWVRLGEAAKADPNSIDVRVLTVQLYIKRGWPGRARKILEELDEVNDARLTQLRVDAEKAPREIPKNAAALERTGTADQLLGLAECYLSLGSLVRAESLLERLVRDGFSPPRVLDLLWAVRGDFDSQQLSTEALLDELAGQEWGHDWTGHEHTESSHVGDVTAHSDPHWQGESPPAGIDQQSFPALFRRDDVVGDVTEAYDEEVTVSSMSTDDEPSVSTTMGTDPDVTPLPGFGDTRIMEVITRGKGVSYGAAEGRIHRSKKSQPSTLDIKAQKDGSEPRYAASILEDEDKDLIVMTRREDRIVHKPDPRRDPVEVLKREMPVPVPRRRRKVKHLEDRIQTEVEQGDMLPAGRPDSAEDADPDTDDVIAGVRTGYRRMAHLGTPLGAVAVLALSAWVLVALMHWIAARQIIEETHQTIVAGDFRALQELEARLDGQMKANRSPLDVRKIELALTRCILWSEYTGDSVRLNAARIGLEEARSMGAPTEEIALVAGFLHLALGDLDTARDMVETLDMSEPLHRVLGARVAFRTRDVEDSKQLVTRMGVVDSGAPLLELLSREALLTASEDVVAIGKLREQLLAKHGNNPFVQIARFHERWDDANETQLLRSLSDVMESLPGPVSPRQEGQLHAQRALLNIERGETDLARQSWAAALVVDPSHPRYLFEAAAERLANNQVLSALGDLERCLDARPWDKGCRRGKVQALIELDRLETARQSVESWRSERASPLDAWVSLAEDNPNEALLQLEGQKGTLANWVRGMALWKTGSEKASSTLSLAIEGWADVQEPLKQILVGRARVAKALIEHPALDVEPMVLESAPTDPFAFMELARALESTGQQASAARVYQRAVELGTENALALHALGLFWFDPRNQMGNARSAWRQYLDLQPNGDRARRTRARMGRR